MTRGSKTVMAGTFLDQGVTNEKSKNSAPKISKKKNEGKKAEVKKSKPVIPVSEWDDSCIRRTKAGRSAIIELLRGLFQLDEVVFPDAPAFEPDGTCRLKFEGAQELKWEELLAASPEAFETLYLGKICSIYFPVFPKCFMRVTFFKANINCL